MVSQDGDRFIALTDRDASDIVAFCIGDRVFYAPGPRVQVNTEMPFKVVSRFHARAGEAWARVEAQQVAISYL